MHLQEIINLLLALPRLLKRFIVLAIDTSLCVLTVWFAYYLRLGEFVPLTGSALIAVGVSVGVAIPIFLSFGLYRAIFRYSGWPALVSVGRAVLIYGVIYATLFTAIGVEGVPRTVGIIEPILLLLCIGASRAMARFWLGTEHRTILKSEIQPRALIYGAGEAGRQLAAALNAGKEITVVGFLDDDATLHGRILNGLIVYNPRDLEKLITTKLISDVLLAMPNIGRKHRNDILNRMQKARLAVRTLPSLSDLAQGKVSTSDLKDLDIDDLLGREAIPPNTELLEKNIFGKVVLITGAGGSIGGELCRQVLTIRPKTLLLIDHSEFALYAIHEELEQNQDLSQTQLIPLLGSVQDMIRMREIIMAWQPDTIYHAAAYKHVPLVEHNPAEGIRNNVIGSLHMAQAALDGGVANLVLVSTDKAVRPTNIMGASKRLAEMILQALATQVQTRDKQTCFSIVRFGNVLGSSGSVVPKFRQQIRSGGPITLTHPEITRYFMTISEAAQLVIQAGAMSGGGEVFVLDMGQPVKVLDLARRMCNLSGLIVRDSTNTEGDIEIQITGLRPGEKLYEELLIGNDPQKTSHERIMKAQEEFIAWPQLELELSNLWAALEQNSPYTIRLEMERLVPSYTPNKDIVDWVYLEQAKVSKDFQAN
jgi:FlaA1/EpsC-like NDP-sugar epimerase